MNFSARLLRYPRVTIAAFLTLLAFTVPAVIQTVVADAAPAASAAKKKKCKKGYKKVNGKCKKKQAASAIVSSVNVRVTDNSIYLLEFAGEVITKSPQTSISVKVIAKCGDLAMPAKVVTATGDGTSTTLAFADKVKNPRSSPAAQRKCKLTIEAVADGVSSGAKPV